MNNKSIISGLQDATSNLMTTEELQMQVRNLSEWKHKAIVQLEYFRLACSLYNFYDTDNINKLLNN